LPTHLPHIEVLVDVENAHFATTLAISDRNHVTGLRYVDPDKNLCRMIRPPA
jgi:hypothetical protein